MRILVFVVALLGILVVGGIGAIWLSVINERNATVELALKMPNPPPELQEAITEHNALVRTTYMLLVGAVLCLVGAVLALMRKGFPAAVVLLLACVGPLYGLIALPGGKPKIISLIALAAPLIAGLLAFLVKPAAVMPELAPAPGKRVGARV
jgi:hypothetical protein